MSAHAASPWVIALPALLIGPVTYLVFVAVLFFRRHHSTLVTP